MATETKKRINIFINDDRYAVADGKMTGRELMELAGVTEGNHLFLEVPGPDDDRPVRPEEEVDLRSGMRFYDVPVGNLG